MSRTFRPIAVAAALLGIVVTAYGVAASPLLSIGAVLGLALVGGTAAWPLIVIGVMLGLGPVDVAFLTGGDRALLPELGGVDMSGIRLIGVCAGLGLVILTRRDLLRALVAPEVRWYVLFLAWGAVSLSFSPDPLEGLRLLFKLAYPLLVFVIVAAPDRTAAEVRRLADWTLAGAAVILLLNPLFVLNGAYAFEEGLGQLRVAGPGSHFNPFSFYLLAILLFSIGRLRARRQVRYLFLGILSVVWMTLALTRITFLAALVGLGVAAVHAAVMDRSVRTLAAMAALGAVVGGLLITGVLERTFGYLPTPGQLLFLLIHPRALFVAVNWQGREILWGILWVVFRRDPLFGSGLGAASTALRETLGEGVPHNEYLRLAVDVGVVGCVLYFLAVAAWIRTVLRSFQRSALGNELTLPALALFAGWAVIAITDNAFDYYGPLTQYCAFLAAACLVAGRGGPLEDAGCEGSEPPVLVSAEGAALPG